MRFDWHTLAGLIPDRPVHSPASLAIRILDGSAFTRTTVVARLPFTPIMAGEHRPASKTSAKTGVDL